MNLKRIRAVLAVSVFVVAPVGLGSLAAASAAGAATDEPRVEAGPDRPLAVGDTFRITGTVQGAPESEAEWTVVSGPDHGDAGRLASPEGETTRFTPTEPGRYVLELSAGSGADRTTDKATFTATYGPLVPIDTSWSKSNPGSRIGGRLFKADVPERYSGPVIQLVALDRKTLAPRTGPKPWSGGQRTYTTTDDRQIESDLATFDSTTLVVLSQHAIGDFGRYPATQYGSIGVQGSKDVRYQNFTAVGVPGMKPGQAYQFGDDALDGKDNGFQGYLTPDQHLSYAFVPLARFPFSFPPTPTQPCQDCTDRVGFRVRLFDPVTNGQIGDRQFDTNTRSSSTQEKADAAALMATMIEQAPQGSVATIESMTDQQTAEAASRPLVGPIPGAVMNRMAAAIASVGGTRDVFNRASIEQHVTAAGGGHPYTLVGWRGAGEGNGAEAGAGLNGTSDTPTLSGVLRPDRKMQLRPASVTTGGGNADALVGRVMQPPSQDWQCGKDVSCSNAPRVLKAISYIGTQVKQLGSDPRSMYGRVRWNADQLLGIKGAIDDVDYPSKETDFSEDEFKTAGKQLKTELDDIAQARGFMAQLARPLTDSGLQNYVDVKHIADDVYTATNPPDDAQSSFVWLDLTKILLSLTSNLTGGATGAVANLIDLGQWATGTSDDGRPTYASVQIAADDLGKTVADRAQATAKQFASLADIIVSDPKKLAYFGRWADCSASDPGCPPEMRWDTSQQVQASETLSRGVGSLAYQRLVPLGYAVFTLNMDDSNKSDSHQGPWVSPPKLPDYICRDFTHVYENVPAESSTSLAVGVDPSANPATGMWSYQTYVLAGRPSSFQEHATAPQAIVSAMFDPVEKGGLGIVQQQFMGYLKSKPEYWTNSKILEQRVCKWGV
jgi:hypothetical protein